MPDDPGPGPRRSHMMGVAGGGRRTIRIKETMQANSMTRQARRGLVGLLGAVALSGMAAANGFELEDLFYNSDQPSRVIFPNNTMLYMGSFTVQITYQSVFGIENLTGLTVVNFGTGTNIDVAKVYFRAFCAKSDTGIVPLTYDGMYTEGDVTQGPQT